jgi:glutamate racemase
MADGKPRLAIIDWGIGGVSIYNLIKSRLGNIPVLYFSDTGVTPYGRMSRRQLVDRMNLLIVFLRSQGVTHLALGCNAASTVLLYLNVAEMKVAGMIEGAVRAAKRKRPARLALLGGRRTVLSGVYRRALAAEGIRVTQRIAQPLSALIESGDISSSTLREQCRRILAPVKDSSHILFACTHYPAITHVLKEYVSPKTVFIDPAEEVVREVGRWHLATGGTDEFLTSGDPERMKRAAFNAFGARIKTARKVVL